MEILSDIIHDPRGWVAIGVVLFAGLAAWKIWPVMGKSLDQYGEKIAAEIQEAEQLKAEAAKLLVEAKKKAKAAEKNAQEIIERAHFEAKLIADEAEKEIEREIEQKMQLAEEKITRAKDQAMENVRKSAVDNAIAAASKILSEEFQTSKNSERLVEKSLRLISSDIR